MSGVSSRARAARLFDVAGRAYVVTGAASGLGLAISEALAANGARVLLLDRHAGKLEQAALRLGTGTTSRAVDVSDAGAVQTAIDGFVGNEASVDGMFANAGISGGAGFGTPAGALTGRLQDQDASHWNRVLQINLVGVLHCLQAVVPAMKRAGRGSIVVTASVAGMQAESFVSYSYAAAKAAVIQLVQQSALELAPFGIRVNAMAPGFVRTDIADGRLHDPAVEAGLARRIPLGRLGSPHEIQGLALLLASDAGSYITGSLLPVDGGVLLGAPVVANTLADASL